jgi:6-phosphogluconolactonase
VNRTLLAPAMFSLVVATACSSDPQSGVALAPSGAALRQSASGAVIVASNAADGNALLFFPREASGALGAPISFSTGGTGTGSGLGNQSALTRSGNLILAVNAGSNDVSVFRQQDGGLTLVDRVPSGGEQPISVTAFGGLVYVLNAGGSGNIAGFTLRDDGHLTAIAGSVRPLGSGNAGPAQIGFSPDGRHLVVTEKNDNALAVYDLGAGFLASGPVAHPSSGQTPFGFAFDAQGDLLVSEAFGGATDASALSSYRLGQRDGVRVISASVGTTETAACWVAVTPDGHYAYVTNTGSASVTGYRVSPDGRVSLLDADGVTGQTGTTPIDLAFAGEGAFLYTLNSAAHSISGFGRGQDGGLTPLDATATLPAGANGMVAW